MVIMDILNRLLAKISSGRWIITVVSIYCLLTLTKTVCSLMESGQIVFESSTYIAIIMSVLNTVGLITAFYFNKSRPTDTVNCNAGCNSIYTTTTTTLPPK